MHYLKMLGLAAVAAIVVMAVAGAGSASATVICKTEPVEHVCPAGWDYPAGTEGTASLKAETTMVLESGSTTLDTCRSSRVTGVSLNTGGASETVNSTLTTLSFGSESLPCTKTTDTINPGTGELHWIPGTNNGTLTTKEAEVTINTIFGTCVYGTGAALDMGTVVGGTGSLNIDATVPKISGNFACPSNATLTAEYVATEPKTAWVAER